MAVKNTYVLFDIIRINKCYFIFFTKHSIYNKKKEPKNKQWTLGENSVFFFFFFFNDEILINGL